MSPGELDGLDPLCSVVRIQIQRPDYQVMKVDLGDCLDILPASDEVPVHQSEVSMTGVSQSEASIT